MKEFRKPGEPFTKESSESQAAGRPIEGEPAYPSSIQKMSEKWRSIKQQGENTDQRGFFERNFLALGIGIALLFLALLIVLGGFAFLVLHWR